MVRRQGVTEMRETSVMQKWTTQPNTKHRPAGFADFVHRPEF
jgi:hypothetical protein